jgi:hypothetical protein
MTGLEAAAMRFLRSVKGYTKLDKIRSEVIKKELKISGIQDVRSKSKQNWINHFERMDNTRLPKHALNYKPGGRIARGRPRKNGNESMPEPDKRRNPWRKMMMIDGCRNVRNIFGNQPYHLLVISIALTIDIWKPITQKAIMLTKSCISMTGFRNASRFFTNL